MISRRELDGAIREYEEAQPSYQNCEKLATFYTLFDHLYRDSEPRVETRQEDVIAEYGDSDFLQVIQGRSGAEIWPIMDELMETILITNPRLYDGVMRKLKGQI